MGSRMVRLCQAPAERAAVREPPPVPVEWAPEVAARVLTALLPRPVTADEAVTRAVGLGLLRHPAAEQPAHFSAETLSRLLLAGYTLPAHVEAGTVARLRAHLGAGRLAFVLLEEELLQVHDSAGELGFLLRPPGQTQAPARLVAPDVLALATDSFLVAALRGWSELPAEGRSFFGGTRDRDGSYHWDTAGCATDAAGRVLRC